VNLSEICPNFSINFDLSKPPQNLDSYDDWNHRVFSADSNKSWVVKTCNLANCSFENISMICQTMRELLAKGIPVANLVPLKSDASCFVYENEKTQCISFVCEFVEGSTLWPAGVSMGIGFLGYLGGVISRLHVATADFYIKYPQYKGVAGWTGEWSIGELPRSIGKRLGGIEDVGWRDSCTELASWVAQKLPITEAKIQESGLSDEKKLKWYRKGLCHTDINGTNVLYSNMKDGQWEMSALLDFGDMCLDYIVYDIGSAGAYACMGQEIDHAETLAAIIKGYDASMPREVVEVVYAVALGRGLLSYLSGTERMVSEPGCEHAARHAKPGMDSAKKHFKYESLAAAVDVIMRILAENS
jgi:Ser/Thr protein kinase RdoA (MazF antagonist)